MEAQKVTRPAMPDVCGMHPSNSFQSRHAVWFVYGIFLRFLENVVGAGVTKKISDQHAARTVHEAIDR